MKPCNATKNPFYCRQPRITHDFKKSRGRVRSHMTSLRNPTSLVKCKAKVKTTHSGNRVGTRSVDDAGWPTNLERVLTAPRIRSVAPWDTFCRDTRLLCPRCSAVF